MMVLALLLFLMLSSCENNVYMPTGTWSVRGKVFDTFSQAMSYLLANIDKENMTARNLVTSDIPWDRTMYLLRDVGETERGEAFYVPESFTGELCINFQGYEYWFDTSLNDFIEIRGGDRVDVINGTTIITEDTASRTAALIVGVRTVTIDEHLIDDRRTDPAAITVTETGTLRITSTTEVHTTKDNPSMVGTLTIEDGGVLIMDSGSVNFTDIDASTNSNITITGGTAKIDAITNVDPDKFEISGGTIINPHEIDDSIGTAIDNGGTPENVEYEIIHELSDWYVVIEATCETDGLEQRICIRENCTSGEGGTHFTETRVIPAFGHDISDWITTDPDVHYKVCSICHIRFEEGEHTYTDWVYNPETGLNECICTVCGRFQTSDHIHSAIHHEAVPHTCTEAGTIEYWECNFCGKLFSDSECKFEITDINDPAPGFHVPTHVAAVPHTCTEDGNIEHWQCQICGKIFADEACETELSEDDIVDYAAHSVNYHAATDNSCTTDGNHAYWQCDVCNKYYSDVNCTTELDYDTDIKIPMTGHSFSTDWAHDDTYHWHVCSNGCGTIGSYGAHSWSEWEYNNETGKKSRTCSVCGMTETEGHTHSSSTWTSDDLNHWHVCDECGTVYGSAAHTFSDWVYDSTLDKDKRTCSICGKVVTRTHVHGTTEAETLVHAPAVAATCTETGNIEYWHCTLCDRYYKDEACGTETTLAGTVTAALGHSTTHFAAVDPTCTATGNIEYWHCERCGKYFATRTANATTGVVTYSDEKTSDELVVPALGHIVKYVYNDDEHMAYCGRCSEELLDWHPHHWDDGVPCEDGQHIIYTCTVCGAIRNATLPEFETYYIGIGTLLVPTMTPSPCGEMKVTRNGNVYTVSYEPHLNSNTDYDINCRYMYNGRWSKYLTKTSDLNGNFSFIATGDRDYYIVMQIFNEGGTITRTMYVNNSRPIGE